MEGSAMNTFKMDSELLTCLLKFIEYFPDYLSALSRTLFWTTFVETAVYGLDISMQCLHLLYFLWRVTPGMLHVGQNVAQIPKSTQQSIAIKLGPLFVAPHIFHFRFHFSQQRKDSAHKLFQVFITRHSNTQNKKSKHGFRVLFLFCFLKRV